ncbi:helix-turn-helix transcriptional regulator [Desulfitibacter alkalitolerans]|uniref:helix-turn-helix transcriptional regulator n=1 Tax=Desulfitibacter alkalitolerans TaxID=264641 RepID=UPI0004806683|nr:YafY family protein [Desulfitibacter alkalitolerans]
MKVDRLISILILLLRRQRVQARELAGMFEVSVRTILRDVETLNLAGIPVVTYQGVNGGIGLAEGYRLDRSILTSDDMAAIITSLRGLTGTIPDTRHDVLVEKLKNTLTQSQLEGLMRKSNQLIIDYEPWGESVFLRKKLADIRSAIENGRKIQFAYSDSTSRKTNRKVEPYSLVLKGQNWYLYAWCMLRSDFRLFKISRIKEMVILETGFEPRDLPMDHRNWERQWQKTDKMIRLELIFESDMEENIEEYFGNDYTITEKGKIRLYLELPENTWLYGFLLSFGDRVEVINPPHIRSIITSTAEKICNIYKQP